MFTLSNRIHSVVDFASDVNEMFHNLLFIYVFPSDSYPVKTISEICQRDRVHAVFVSVVDLFSYMHFWSISRTHKKNASESCAKKNNSADESLYQNTFLKAECQTKWQYKLQFNISPLK